MTLPVLLAVPGPAEAVLVAGWEALRRDLVVVRRCADLTDVLAAATAGLARAAVLGAQLPGVDSEALDLLRRNGVTVVVLVEGPGDDEAAEHRWRQLGVQRFVAAGQSPGDVARQVLAAVDRAADDGAPAAAPVVERQDAPVVPGRTLAVWGPTGSTGRTTVAVNVAAELADGGARVLLVDADTRGASVGQVLGVLDEAPGLLAAVRSAADGRLDVPTLRAHAPEVVAGLAVLTGAPDPTRWREVRPAAFRRVLEVASAAFDWVVLDLPGGLDDVDGDRGRDALSHSVFEVADVIAVTGAADPVGLQRWVRTWQRLPEVAPGTPAVPVVTRVRATAVGGSPTRGVADALRRFAGVEDVVQLPEDPAADACLLAGRTLGEGAPRSVLRRCVRELTGRLEAAADAPVDPLEAFGEAGFDPLLARS